MKMGEFREALSPSHSPNTTLLHHNSIHGDFSSNVGFSLNSSLDYSPTSSFSNRFYSSNDSTPFASPPFNGIITNNNQTSPTTYNADDLDLCEDLYRMKIAENVVEDPLGLILESENTDGFISSGFFRSTKESITNSWLNNTSDQRRNNPPQNPESFANYRQIGWPNSYSNPSGYENIGFNSNRESPPFFCQGTLSMDSFYSPYKGYELPPFISDNGKTNENCHQSVYQLAKDQNGCRFLQRIFDEGTSLDVMIIFNEVIAHVVELMMDPFGNYLMQKLLDVCTEEQRTQIVLVVTSEPGQLIRISLNAYGTRVVQRLVETIRTGKQISLVKSALRPGFLDLIKDLNGNHVIQRCLQCLSTEDNKFIFDAATKFCTEIATHRHGCCVLQKCISYSMRQQQEKLIGEISRNSLLLAQDPFGNYAVQYVLELRIPCAIAMMLSELKGHYVHLSMQKFSSHTVERCLMYCPESRPQIVRELVSVPHFDQLLQDPFANFVIQAALANTKGPLHASLVEVIRPHWILRNNPYCKRIFSRNLLKK